MHQVEGCLDLSVNASGQVAFATSTSGRSRIEVDGFVVREFENRIVTDCAWIADGQIATIDFDGRVWRLSNCAYQKLGREWTVISRLPISGLVYLPHRNSLVLWQRISDVAWSLKLVDCDSPEIKDLVLNIPATCVLDPSVFSRVGPDGVLLKLVMGEEGEERMVVHQIDGGIRDITADIIGPLSSSLGIDYNSDLAKNVNAIVASSDGRKLAFYFSGYQALMPGLFQIDRENSVVTSLYATENLILPRDYSADGRSIYCVSGSYYYPSGSYYYPRDKHLNQGAYLYKEGCGLCRFSFSEGDWLQCVDSQLEN